MKFKRVFYMPTGNTFEMAPVQEIFHRHKVGCGWADPFARDSQWAEFNNDLNPETSAASHMDAEDFMHQQTNGLAGVLFDPPYSPRQISEIYNQIGLPVGMRETQNSRLYKRVKDVSAQKIAVGGKAICFGWNSQGFGLGRGFELVEVLLIAHGGAHNDTICTVEIKQQGQLV